MALAAFCTSSAVTSSPSTVAITPRVGVPVPRKLELPKPGTSVITMNTQIIVSRPPRRTFLIGPGVCRNRIISSLQGYQRRIQNYKLMDTRLPERGEAIADWSQFRMLAERQV